MIGLKDAQDNNNGNRRGTLRSLNLSYNPFHKGPERARMDKHNGAGSSPKKNLIGDQDDCQIDNFFESSNDSDAETTPVVHLNNFAEVLLSLIKSRFLKKCTHLDLSGIQAID